MEFLSNVPGVKCDGLLGTDIMLSSGEITLWDGPLGLATIGD